MFVLLCYVAVRYVVIVVFVCTDAFVYCVLCIAIVVFVWRVVYVWSYTFG